MENLAIQLKYDTDQLFELMKDLAEVMCNQDFVKQTLAINDSITLISAEN